MPSHLRIHRFLTLRLLLPVMVATTVLSACGDDNAGPQGTASITGTVKSTNGTPLQGAALTAGSAHTTSDAAGVFVLSGVTPGPAVVLRADRPGYIGYASSITIAPGSNSSNIVMAERLLYQNGSFAVYVPSGVGAINGVVLALSTEAGNRAIALFNGANPEITELATQYGLAFLGVDSDLENSAASDAKLFENLAAVATASDRPEMADAPVLARGGAVGGLEAYGLTLRHPERVLGFMVLHSDLSTLGSSPAAQQVPGYIVLGGTDETVNEDAVRSFFDQNRAAGAIWAFALEPQANHNDYSEELRVVTALWVDDVLTVRLPSAGSTEPRTVSESAGWLGNLTTHDIAAYAAYPGDKLKASWVPSEATAVQWQGLMTP